MVYLRLEGNVVLFMFCLFSGKQQVLLVRSLTVLNDKLQNNKLTVTKGTTLLTV